MGKLQKVPALTATAIFRYNVLPMNKELIYPAECYAIRGAIYEVHNEMGSGFRDEVYQQCLERELTCRGIPYDAKKELRIYALDERMLDVVQTDKALKVPAKFNAEAFFSNYFGIIVGSDAKPSTVKIKVLKDQVKYIETLRLHPSQTCVEQTPEYNVYQFHLVPTIDFQQEILSHGSDYEVLSPEWFRDEIKGDIARMYKNYGL